jgi:hypothetical protein
MRKHVSFAVAATVLVLAAAFWAKSGVLAKSGDVARPNLSYFAPPGSYLPVRTLEPTW